MPKFFVDAMLGNLAKWLRIGGYDTLYYRALEGLNFKQIIESEKRIFLTRSHKFEKEFKDNLFFINSNYLKEQIKQVKEAFSLTFDNLFSLCLVCNILLLKVNKEEIKVLVPPYVYENQNKFSLCQNCKRIYWEGTHYKKMQEKLKLLLF